LQDNGEIPAFQVCDSFHYQFSTPDFENLRFFSMPGAREPSTPVESMMCRTVTYYY
jgi:hypothetical protein